MSTNVFNETFVVNPMHPKDAETCVCTRDILADVDTVADRLRWLIARDGSSARALSIKAGKSPNAVQKILERGGSANGDTIAALARAAGVSEAWLLTGKGSAEEGAHDTQPPSPIDLNPPPVSTATPTTPANPLEESPLVHALGAAFDHTRHNVNDLRAVQDALSDGSFQWQRVEDDLVELARTWLDAAASIRREGQHVSTVSILYRVTVGKAAQTRMLAARRNEVAEADDGRSAGGPKATGMPYSLDESGPSGIRVVSPGGSPAVPKTAKQ